MKLPFYHAINNESHYHTKFRNKLLINETMKVIIAQLGVKKETLKTPNDSLWILNVRKANIFYKLQYMLIKNSSHLKALQGFLWNKRIWYSKVLILFFFWYHDICRSVWVNFSVWIFANNLVQLVYMYLKIFVLMNCYYYLLECIYEKYHSTLVL